MSRVPCCLAPRAVIPLGTAPLQPWSAAARRFADDRRGAVALTYGLLTFLMFTFVGAAVDFGRYMQARRVTMEAIDAGALAGLRNYQDTQNKGSAEAQALTNYQANIANRVALTSDTFAFRLVDNGNSITMQATGNGVYRPIFFSLLPSIMNINALPLLRNDQSEHPVSKLAVGKNAGTSLEVSLMLDITGSMQDDDGTGKSRKIQTLRTAATNLVNIVVWDDQSKYTSRIALVPFSDAVNLGDAWTTAARGPVTTVGACRSTPGSSIYCPPRSASDPTVLGDFYITTNCVTERTGQHAYTDVSPLVAPVGRLYRPRNSRDCPTKSPVIPLTSDRTKLINAIKGFTASGGTMGQIGTAWAWYTLSPSFNTLFNTAGAAAAGYDQLTKLNAKGKPALQKIAVLLTDGDYNDGGYCNGIRSSLWPGCTPNNGDSEIQARKVCAGMKAKGITIYTIGFRVGTNAKAMLIDCATSPEHFFDATDGNKLTQAFTDIAYKLVPPFLSH